ncbi:melanoma receptor tyrosine-protein kinase-like [Chaetodon trifascialis]|uniref:melanoma receptor tyrosine-protein kinase-like n=1 Tax=Chaetodon trifascialis TaxID=109706 RepID=UPI00399267E6
MKFCGGGAALLLLLLLLLGRCRCTNPGRRVCQGTNNILSRSGGADYHYDNMVKAYSNCSVVLDNLEITHTKEHHDLSFLQSIEEVGGNVLIALNEPAIIPLVNLRLIRGQKLYHNQFALTLMLNYKNDTVGLKELQLSSLTEILRGGVKMVNNPLLCNTDTIQWWEILDRDSNPSLVFDKGAIIRTCQKCDKRCTYRSCWTPGLDHCQKFTKLQCASQCSRRCWGPKPTDCCHEHCAAGCTGPRATDCLACRELNDNGTCKSACPPLTVYDHKTRQMVKNPDGKFSLGATCVESCPDNYVAKGGSCVCSAGMYEVEENGVQRCKPCDGPCPKVCDGVGVGALMEALAIDSSNIESFRNCTKINGNIEFFEVSFTGYYTIPPMDPAKLEYFRTVKEITGYLLIQSWPENLTSLSVFENLEIIRGRTTRALHSFLVIGTKHLRWLGLRSLKEVSAGGVYFKDNPQLCYTQADQWTHLFRSTEQTVTMRNNTPTDVCEQQNRTCDTECTNVGCWGPGPTMCVSCRHFNRRGRCVSHCNLLQGEPREVQVNSSCVECHPECLLKTDIPTCHGPGPDQCSQCAHFKDGPHCVPHCPHGVLGDADTLIWKYPDRTGQCQSCHQNCTQGCSGPGLSGCAG